MLKQMPQQPELALPLLEQALVLVLALEQALVALEQALVQELEQALVVLEQALVLALVQVLAVLEQALVLVLEQELVVLQALEPLLCALITPTRRPVTPILSTDAHGMQLVQFVM